jgi:hypothetical protein
MRCIVTDHAIEYVTGITEADTTRPPKGGPLTGAGCDADAGSGVPLRMHETIRHHMEAIATARHVPRLLDAASVVDRSRPVALQWVGRWYPLRAAAMVPACSCAAGRCLTCN